MLRFHLIQILHILLEAFIFEQCPFGVFSNAIDYVLFFDESLAEGASAYGYFDGECSFLDDDAFIFAKDGLE